MYEYVCLGRRIVHASSVLTMSSSRAQMVIHHYTSHSNIVCARSVRIQETLSSDIWQFRWVVESHVTSHPFRVPLYPWTRPPTSTSYPPNPNQQDIPPPTALQHGLDSSLNTTHSESHSPNSHHPTTHPHRSCNEPPRPVPRQSSLSQTR